MDFLAIDFETANRKTRSPVHPHPIPIPPASSKHQ
jgi:hypothetical protein